MTATPDLLLRRLRCGCLCVLLAGPAAAGGAPATSPGQPAATGATADRPTVLLTNDDGIDEPRLHALARGFAQVAEVVVVAPLGDRSGSSTHLTLLRRGDLRVEPRQLGDGIRALGLDGYPADCVVFGVLGPLAGELPDLVVSGINGGTNPGPAWLGSGTVGAARMAAALGVPAIAVSGLDDSLPGATAAVVRWVVELARGPLVRGLDPGRYLTVSIPRVEPGEVTGVEIVDRDPLSTAGLPRYRRVAGTDDGGETWRATGPFGPLVAEPRRDVAALAAGRIAVVPMRVGEVDHETLERWRAAGAVDQLPDWPPVIGEGVTDEGFVQARTVLPLILGAGGG